jgi:hypothetical protein
MKKLKDIKAKLAGQLNVHFKSEHDEKHSLEGESIPNVLIHFKDDYDKDHTASEEADEPYNVSESDGTTPLIKGRVPGGDDNLEHKSLMPETPMTDDDVAKTPFGEHTTRHLKEVHKKAIRNYTISSHTLNRTLIKNNEPPKSVPLIQQAATHHYNTLSGGIKTYSGINPRMAQILSKTKIGGKVHSPAFISSSLSKRVAFSFAKPVKKDDDGIKSGEMHIAVFHLPKGHHKAMYVGKISDQPGEREVLHAHGQTYKKVAEERGGKDSYMVYHHLIPHEKETS